MQAGYMLHYWFADYVIKAGSDNATMYENFNKAKYFGANGILPRQFQQRVALLNTGEVEDFEGLVELISTDNEELRKNIFEKNKFDNVSVLSILNAYQNSIAPGKTVEELTATELADIINAFTDKMNKILEKIYETLVTDRTWDDYKGAVIDQYAKHKVVNGSLAQAVVQDFITHDGLKSIEEFNEQMTGGKANDEKNKQFSTILHTCLRNLAVLLEELPNYGGPNQTLSMTSMNYSTGTKAGETGSGGDTLAIIASKMQGLLSNVIGQGGEIAWKEAEKIGLSTVLKEVGMVAEARNDVATNVQTKVTEDIRQQDPNKGESNSRTVSKGDVRVTIKKGSKVIIEYDVSVKTYKFDKKANYKTVSLVGGTPFFDALMKMHNNDRQVLRYAINVAGGHEGVGTVKVANDKGKMVNNTKYTIADLNQRWDVLVQNVVAFNFIDYLAGFVTKEGPTTLYLVVNGQILKIQDILANIAASADQNKLDFASRVYQQTKTQSGTGSVTLKRATLMKLNQWIWATDDGNNNKNRRKASDRDNEAADIRSEKSTEQIINALKQQKLSVTLTHLEAMLK